MLSYFNRFIDWFLMRDQTADQLQNPLQLMASVGDVNVLVCEPDGKFSSVDAKDALLEAFITALSSKPGLSIRQISKSLKPNLKGSLSEQFAPVAEQGRAWLKEENCDLLLWGKLELESQAVRWYFLSAKAGEANLGVPGMIENILVPFIPDPAVMDVLYAAIFAATTPNHPSHALKIGEHLLGAVDPLTKLPSGLNRKLPDTVRTSAMGMCAVVLANIARRGEEIGWFDPAIQAFNAWLEMVEKDKRPIEWALTQNHHGWLYEDMATHEEDAMVIEHIEMALEIFEEVCTVFTQQKHPLEWAVVRMRMGSTCARTGRVTSTSEYLQKSARYFKQCLDVYTLDAYPLNWADCMTRMAKSMMLHGQMVKGSQSLEQAGVAFQAALKVYTEEKYPAQWASTQNNLGATLFALAKRDANTPQWLEHALICFDGARHYYEENKKPQMVHVIDKNIQRVLELKATRDADLLN